MINKSLLAIVFIFLSFSVYADYSEHLYDKAAEYQNYKKKSQKIKSQEREILSKIYKINRQQRKLAKNKSTLLKESQRLVADLLSTKKEIKNISKQVATIKNSITLRIRSLQKAGPAFFFQSFFGSKDLYSIDKSSRLVYKVSELDIGQIKEYEMLKTSLSKKKNKIKSIVTEIEINKLNLEKKESQFKKSSEEKMQILSRLTVQDKKILMKIQNVRENAKKYAKRYQLEDLSLMFNGSIYESKGHLKKPIRGAIRQKFGLMRLPYEKLKIYNKGWFLANIKDQPVQSVYQGKVVYKGLMPYYGRVVIISHGDHYYSIYGNLKNISINKGDPIEAGQAIASTSKSRVYGRGMYFEIRHFSEPLDPKEWFEDSRVNISSVKEI